MTSVMREATHEEIRVVPNEQKITVVSSLYLTADKMHADVAGVSLAREDHSCTDVIIWYDL